MSKSQLRRIAIQQRKQQPIFSHPTVEQIEQELHEKAVREQGAPYLAKEETMYGVIPVNMFFLP